MQVLTPAAPRRWIVQGWTGPGHRRTPEAYAAALRLRDEHRSDEVIAGHLGITIEAVAPLLRIATAKKDNLIATSERTDHNTQTAERNPQALTVQNGLE